MGDTIRSFLGSPSALATIVVAIVGQLLFTAVYQVRENDRLEARVEANELAVKELRITVRELADRSDANDRLLATKVDAIDIHGTRQMETVVATQQRVLGNIDKIQDRLAAIERLFSTLDNRTSTFDFRVIVQTKDELDGLEAVVNKMDDRQNRIVQALDNTYNMIEEYIKANPSRTPPEPPQKKP